MPKGLCRKVYLLLVCLINVVINVERLLGTVKGGTLHLESAVLVQHRDNLATYMISCGSSRNIAPCNLEGMRAEGTDRN